MGHAMLFGEVLEAIDQLSPEEQETLLDIVQHRLVERGRKQLAADIEDDRIEFAAGRCRPATVEKLMKELEPLDSD